MFCIGRFVGRTLYGTLFLLFTAQRYLSIYIYTIPKSGYFIVMGYKMMGISAKSDKKLLQNKNIL